MVDKETLACEVCGEETITIFNAVDGLDAVAVKACECPVSGAKKEYTTVDETFGEVKVSEVRRTNAPGMKPSMIMMLSMASMAAAMDLSEKIDSVRLAQPPEPPPPELPVKSIRFEREKPWLTRKRQGDYARATRHSSGRYPLTLPVSFGLSRGCGSTPCRTLKDPEGCVCDCKFCRRNCARNKHAIKRAIADGLAPPICITCRSPMTRESNAIGDGWWCLRWASHPDGKIR